MAATLRTIDYSALQQCMHCGLCLPTCPTYDATKHERNSPRGRISLMRAIADGEATISKTFADEMSYCLGCLACQTACPAGVDYAELFETARNDIESSGVNATPWRRAIRAVALGGLFMHPRALRAFGRGLRAYQRTGMAERVRSAGLTRLLPRAIREAEPQAPPIADAFSDELIAPVESPRVPARHSVAVLTGCVQDLVLSQVNRDTVDVLLANGCEVSTPPVQPCCGSLHAHNGDREHARVLARRMIDLLPPHKFDAIISNAGGCGSHLRRYHELLGDDPRYRESARIWDHKVRDVHEWLVEIGYRPPTAAPFTEPVVLTYHDSCHLVHGQKISRPPRTVLASLRGVTLVDLPESTWCCGSAGVYALTQPGQAEALLDRKVTQIQSTGAGVLATANPGCHLQIVRGLRARGRAVRVVHPISLLADAYRRERTPASAGASA